MSREAMQLALEALEDVPYMSNKDDYERLERVTTALRQALEKPKYRRGDRLLCLETEEYCVIHISGTDRQYVKFPDGHVGQYTDQQVADHFELLPKEVDETAAPPKQWVGLTEREVELIDEMIETQLLHAERCDHMANSTMAQKQKAWDLERVELLRKLKEKNT